MCHCPCHPCPSSHTAAGEAATLELRGFDFPLKINVPTDRSCGNEAAGKSSVCACVATPSDSRLFSPQELLAVQPKVQVWFTFD